MMTEEVHANQSPVAIAEQAAPMTPRQVHDAWKAPIPYTDKDRFFSRQIMGMFYSYLLMTVAFLIITQLALYLVSIGLNLQLSWYLYLVPIGFWVIASIWVVIQSRGNKDWLYYILGDDIYYFEAEDIVQRSSISKTRFDWRSFSHVELVGNDQVELVFIKQQKPLRFYIRSEDDLAFIQGRLALSQHTREISEQNLFVVEDYSEPAETPSLSRQDGGIILVSSSKILLLEMLIVITAALIISAALPYLMIHVLDIGLPVLWLCLSFVMILLMLAHYATVWSRKKQVCIDMMGVRCMKGGQDVFVVGWDEISRVDRGVFSITFHRNESIAGREFSFISSTFTLTHIHPSSLDAYHTMALQAWNDYTQMTNTNVQNPDSKPAQPPGTD